MAKHTICWTFMIYLHWANANFFFDICLCSVETLHWILYEPIWKRCRICFRTNINEPLMLRVKNHWNCGKIFQQNMNSLELLLYHTFSRKWKSQICHSIGRQQKLLIKSFIFSEPGKQFYLRLFCGIHW